MKSLSQYLFGYKKETKTSGGLADFLLHAPTREKMEIFTKAAEKANEDQRATFERSRFAQAGQ